jgi:hypothetical protein
MKLLLNIFCFLIFLLTAFNAGASPQKDDVKQGVFGLLRLRSVTDIQTPKQYKVVDQIQIQAFDFSNENQLNCNFVVDIGSRAESLPILTDWGNSIKTDNEFTIHNNLRNFIPHAKTLIYKLQDGNNDLLTRLNKGLSCGAMGDMYSLT